jgi:hypothetical protein
MEAGMGDDAQPPLGVFETTGGGALAAELVELLESELVRFCHRVTHDHGIELDRARAAMTLLGTVIGSGIGWTARPDSDPARIREAFTAVLPRDPTLAPILRRELAGFFVATAEVKVVDDAARSPAARLRRAGADPQLWRWAAAHPDPERCWEACGTDAEKLVQVALAFGVTADRVGRAVAGALRVLVTRTKTRHTAQRSGLVAVLGELASSGVAALADPALVSTITRLAFEMTAAQQAWWNDQRAAPDGLAEVSILAFQLVELVQAAARIPALPPDVERHAALASRAARTLQPLGLQLAAMLRKELDEPFAAAIAEAAAAPAGAVRPDD